MKTFALIINTCNSDQKEDDILQKLSFEHFYGGEYTFREINIPINTSRKDEYVCTEIMRMANSLQERSVFLVESLERISHDSIRIRLLALALHKHHIVLKSMKDTCFNMALLEELKLDDAGCEVLLKEQLRLWENARTKPLYDIQLDKTKADYNHYQAKKNHDPRGVRHALIVMNLSGRHMYFNGTMTHKEFAVWFNDRYDEQINSRIVSNVVNDIKKKIQSVLECMKDIQPQFGEVSFENKKLYYCFEAHMMYRSLCTRNLPQWRLEALIAAESMIGLYLYHELKDYIAAMYFLNYKQAFCFDENYIASIIKQNGSNPINYEKLYKGLLNGARSGEETFEYYKQETEDIKDMNQLGEYLNDKLIWIH